MDDRQLMHAVVFWLRPETAGETAAAMATFYQDRIAAVDGVLSVFVGPPAGTDRDVVDSSYQLLSAVVFDSVAAATAWQTDPVHDDFRERFGPHFERVQVYDTLAG